MLLQLGAEVAEPLVVWEFPKENVRMLAELKRYVEAQPQQWSPSLPEIERPCGNEKQNS
jgi:hypothetical protein